MTAKEFLEELKSKSEVELTVKRSGRWTTRERIVNTVSARSMKGQNVDTRTRRIMFDDRMKVSLKPISN
jgi:hypothetical protein